MFIGQTRKKPWGDIMGIREQIDVIIAETVNYDDTMIPASLASKIETWKWGSYGWVSPASLIFTAAWRKMYYPDEDCCKIWARDERNNPIPGGYSIRSEDESVSIPLLAKHGLCQGFCSDNSGMQGSRAIEKMRSLGRLNADFDATQRTVFDLKLFAGILNEINALDEEQAEEVLKLLIVIAKSIRTKRHEQEKALFESSSETFDVMGFLDSTPDPELTKCIVAACLNIIFRPHECAIAGVEDYRTAADTRAEKPGDLCILYDDEPRIAIEVKDKTQSIDWNNITSAKRILDRVASVRNFIFVLEKTGATVEPVIAEMLGSEQLATPPCNKISIISVHDLFLLASAVVDSSVIVQETAKYLAVAPAVKPETKDKWILLINEIMQAEAVEDEEDDYPES
jgi:hypothetical protein